MTITLGLMSAMAAVAVGAADPAGGPAATAIADLVDVTNSVCYPVATQELVFSGKPDSDQQVMLQKNMTFGVSSDTLKRFGRVNETILNRSIMGQRVSGADAIVVSVGGDMPGCKTVLLSASTASVTDEAAKALSASSLGWKEVPSTNQPGAPLQKRMFVRRDSKGTPYLLNLFTTSVPESQMRLFTTVNPIPDNVRLPEGF